MIRTLIVTEDTTKIDVPLSSLKDDAVKWFWVDFSHPVESETQMLSDYFHFHPLAIEDCVSPLQRPKLDYYDNFNFFTTHAVDKKDLTKNEVGIFLGNNFIVTYHQETSNEIDYLWSRISHDSAGHSFNVQYVFYEILDKIVDNYFPLLYEIEDRLNEIDQNSAKEPMEVLMEQLYDIRRDLLSLRQIIFPMRDLLYRILNSTRIPELEDRKPYFADIYDHLLKLSDMVQANRDIAADIRENHSSVNSYQQNKAMMILTVITVIFSPLTFITGFYGMNFKYLPGLTSRYGYYAVVTVMLVICVSLIQFFRKKGWF
jgi:magnesium transporter